MQGDSMSDFVTAMTARLDEESRDGVARRAVAQRLGVTISAIHGWIHEGRAPLPRSFPAIARFLGVKAEQMSEWFPEAARKAGLSRGRPLWGGERRGA
jgi:transcriptional regulator with XRE-family HTH domain